MYFSSSQRGNVMVYSLLLLGFISVIGFTLHHLAYMELKMSIYEHRANQARELAEAASLLAMEQIYFILENDCIYVQDFPATIAPEDNSMSIFSDDKIMETGIIKLTDHGSDFCIYSYTCNGSYQGAKKTLHLKVAFDFIEYYRLQPDINGDRQEIFSYRQFLNRGRFVEFIENE